MATLTKGTLGILWSAPPRVYSRDVDYEYRQDSDLLYLTGVEQPETILVLVPGSRTRKEILFIRPSNPRREHYVGHFPTVEEARAQTGIETVFLTTQFDEFLASMFNRRPFGLSVDAARDDRITKRSFARSRRAPAGWRCDSNRRRGSTRRSSDEYAFANRARERLIGVSIVNLAPAVHALRQVKTPYEQALLRQSVDISAEAHVAGMKAARPERYEFEVEVRDRAGLPCARRDVARLSIHRRQRPQREHAALHGLVAADARG